MRIIELFKYFIKNTYTIKNKHNYVYKMNVNIIKIYWKRNFANILVYLIQFS